MLLSVSAFIEMIVKNTRRSPAFRFASRPAVSGLLLFMLAPLIVTNLPGSTPAVSREYQIKAAFLYNFTRFVEWVPEYFETEDSPILIHVLGTNPFGDELRDSFAGREVSGRGFKVEFVPTFTDSRTPHLLFVPAGAELLIDGDLNEIHQQGVLTVGESEAFVRMGGVITFTLHADRVRFFVNRDSARDANLTISTQLLQLALTPR